MKAARIVFPGFWFGQTELQPTLELARRGVGGFCVYGGTARETADFIARVREASPYDHLLICADINEDLSDAVKDAPRLAANWAVGTPKETDGAYKKGNLLALQARSLGIDWLLCPVVDLGYASPCFGDDPRRVGQLAGDFVAGVSNGGALNCVKYFPGVSGVLKTLGQMEDAEFMPYKHLFRRADAIMPSDMIFSNIDNDNQAMLSDKMIKGLLKKRLNYKGCVMGFPLFKSRVRHEAASALKMLYCGVENILAPKDPSAVVDAVEREADKGMIFDEIVRAVSNHELLISKILSGPQPLSMEEAFAGPACGK